MNHHRDRGSDSDNFNDPSTWQKASYDHHPCDDLEPLPDAPNGYRQAAIHYLQIILAVDRFIEEAEDARFAVIVVAVVLGWPSTRGLSISNIAGQLGCSPSTITRACDRFREMARLAGGGVRFIRPGAGSSNGDKPAAVQA